MTEEDEIGERSGLERTLAISDGVFAFAITLLVLDLLVPTLSSNSSSSDLWRALKDEYSSFFSYFLSFLIASVWWNAHHRSFSKIRHSDSTLRWLNLLFLVWIALLPFFTKILDHYINLQLGVVLYATDQAAAGAFLTLSWVYASRKHRLIDTNLTQSTINFTTLRTAISTIFFLSSILISFINPIAAVISWVGMIPTLSFARWVERKSNKKSVHSKKII